MPSEWLQFAGSLVAVALIVALVRALRLGEGSPLADEDAVRDAAREAVDGFEPVEVALDPGQGAALARDGAGRVLLLRAHGARTAARLLPPGGARLEAGALLVDPADRPFGTVSLHVDDPYSWLQAIGAGEKA